MNTTLTNAEEKVGTETSRSKHLQQLLSKIEDNIFVQKTGEQIRDVQLEPQKNAVDSPKIKVPVVKKIFPVNPILQPPPKVVIDTTKPVVIREDVIVMYEFEIKSPIRISATQSLTQLSGLILVKYNQAQQPKDIKARMQIKETDEEINTRNNEVSCKVVKAQVNMDNTVLCVFKEFPKPALNEFGLPNYQRGLSIAISGSLNATTLDGQLAWNDINERPMNTRIRIPIARK